MSQVKQLLRCPQIGSKVVTEFSENDWQIIFIIKSKLLIWLRVLIIVVVTILTSLIVDSFLICCTNDLEIHFPSVHGELSKSVKQIISAALKYNYTRIHWKNIKNIYLIYFVHDIRQFKTKLIITRIII